MPENFQYDLSLNRSMPPNERFVELVDTRRRASLRYNSALFSKLQPWYNAYRGYWQGRQAQFRNNISFPFTFAMIQSDVARKVQTIFGQWPIVEFEGYAPEDQVRAKKNTLLHSAQMRDCDTRYKAMNLLLQTAICGTGIARIGWRNLRRKTVVTQMEEIAPGLEIPVRREIDAELFNGPNWEVVNREDFWQQPARTDIDSMAWVVHRYFEDYDNLLEDAEQRYPYFMPGKVKQLREFPLQGQGQVDFNERRVTFRNEFDYIARQSERFSKPVEIWEMHGLVPREFAPDGVRHRCIAIANQRLVIKNDAGPMPNQRKPFRAVAPMGDPYSFDGVSKAEIAFGPQQTINRLANQKLDAIDLIIDPMYVASDAAGINTQNLFTRAGRIFTVSNADEQNFRPLTPNVQGVQLAYQEISQLFQFMQLGTGETDALLGVAGARERETARGFLGRQENALTRLGLEAMVVERFVEGVADDFRTLNRRLLSFPYERTILGTMAMIDPATGVPYPPERVSVGAEDLRPDYRARAIGASLQMNLGNRQQMALSVTQAFSTNPALFKLMNWANWAREVLPLYGYRNVDTYLIQNQVPAVNLLEGGPQANGLGANTNDQLAQLSPDILGRLLGGQSGPAPLAALAGA